MAKAQADEQNNSLQKADSKGGRVPLQPRDLQELYNAKT